MIQRYSVSWQLVNSTLLLVFFACVSHAVARDNVWTSVGPYNSSIMDDLVIDPSNPQILYAGSNGLWKSTNGGASWMYLNQEGLPSGNVLTIATDPLNPQIVYAGGGMGLYKSTNGGVSWTALKKSLPDATYFFDLAIDPSNPQTLYGQTYKGLLKSMDGGTSWTKVHPYEWTSAVHALAIDPSNPQVLYFGTGNSPGKTDGGLYKSADGGASWTQLNVPKGRVTRITFVTVDPSRHQVVYAIALGDSNVYKSTDGGTSWTSFKPDPKGGPRVVAIDPSNSQVLYVGTFSGVYKTTDGGASWTLLNAGTGASRTVGYIVIDPSTPQIIYVGITFDGIYKSTDGGKTWTKLKFSSSGTIFIVRVPASPRTLYTSVGSLYRTTDGGATWTKFSTSGVSCVIDPSNPQTIYLGMAGSGVRKSIDGGSTWTDVSSGFPTANRYITALAIDPST